MKIISVDVKCDYRNNSLDISENNAFLYDIFIKYDSTTNFLGIKGCNKGGAFAYLANQIDDKVVNLYCVPKEIKTVFEKLNDKCDGFKINDDLYEVARNYLIRELSGLNFEFSDKDADLIKKTCWSGVS